MRVFFPYLEILAYPSESGALPKDERIANYCMIDQNEISKFTERPDDPNYSPGIFITKSGMFKGE